MQYRIGHYILDSDKHVLLKEKDRALVSDSYRIIEVLVILAKEYPRVVSRTELLEAIWPKKEVTDWALSRLIADIRRLLGETGEQDQILSTVHGIGFRLAVPVTVLAEENQIEPLISAPSNIKHRAIVLGTGLVLALLVMLTVFVVRDPKDPADGDDLPPEQDPRLELQGQRFDGKEKTEILPFTEGWATTNNLSIDFRDGASFSPTAFGDKLGYQYFGPANLNNALVLFDISVSQEYIDSGAVLQPYAILLFGNWRGEWDCAIESSELSTESRTFECKLDEPGAIFNVGADESVRIGVQSLAQGPVAGTITVHKLQIKHAPSFVDKDWVASDGLPVTYHGGVQYSPNDGGQRLEFKYNGPENLQGATIVFTIEASPEYIDSGATILPFAQSPSRDWWGEWNCLTPNSALSPVGSRIECKLDEPDDLFNLGENENLLIGIMSKRGEKRMEGTVKVKNVEIILP